MMADRFCRCVAVKDFWHSLWKGGEPRSVFAITSLHLFCVIANGRDDTICVITYATHSMTTSTSSPKKKRPTGSDPMGRGFGVSFAFGRGKSQMRLPSFGAFNISACQPISLGAKQRNRTFGGEFFEHVEDHCGQMIRVFPAPILPGARIINRFGPGIRNVLAKVRLIATLKVWNVFFDFTRQFFC